MVRGSSPLTRGKPARCVLRGASSRLIPAHAGKTWASRWSLWSRRAHPRSRGENMISTKGTAKSEGSSPLTRGKRPPRSPRGGVCGLIPAHAGKTSRRACRWPPIWAHPRSRGENACAQERAHPCEGSSPLTRGKLGVDALHTLHQRLIPAHAGKTVREKPGRHDHEAHPRSRGENTS